MDGIDYWVVLLTLLHHVTPTDSRIAKAKALPRTSWRGRRRFKSTWELIRNHLY
jgi:hypothetical protein